MRSLKSRLGTACLALAAAAATITITAPAAQAAYPPGFKSVGYQPSWSSNIAPRTPARPLIGTTM